MCLHYKSFENTVGKLSSANCFPFSKNLKFVGREGVKNVLSLVLRRFLYLEAFECKTTSDWQKPYGSANLQNLGDKELNTDAGVPIREEHFTYIDKKKFL